MFDDYLLPITEKEILLEVSEELNIPIEDVEKTFKIWIKYLKYIAKDTDQPVVDFPHLGKMYFSKHRCKYITTKQEKEYRDKKLNNIYNFFEGLECKNDHEDVPIVHRWGLNRPNYFELDENKFTTSYLIEKQNKKFYEEGNKFLK